MSLEEKRRKQLELVLGERGPLIRGSLGTRARVCGRGNCRCAEGQLHESKYLSATVDGRTRQVHVPAGDEADVTAGVKRYQRWHSLRAEIAEVGREQLSILDALGATLLESYPAEYPIPPAAKRGRKPKQERAPGY
jgi:hypothetical protein